TGPQVEAFYYSYHYLSDGILPDTEEETRREREENCREWYHFTGGKADLADIREFMYSIEAEYFLQAWRGKRLEDVFPRNSFIQWAIGPGKTEVVEYLAFAKRHEWLYIADRDPWQEGTSALSFEDKYCELLQDALLLLDRVESPFLKQRMAFQVIRQYSRFEEAAAAVQVYERYLKREPACLAKTWSALEISEAYSRKPEVDDIEASRWRLTAFGLSKGAKTEVYRRFDFQREHLRRLRPQLDAQTRKLLTAIEAIHTPGPAMDKLRTLYQQEPGNYFIPLLITREINKIEDWLYTQALTGYEDHLRAPKGYYDGKTHEWKYTYTVKNCEKDLLYLSQLADFLKDAGDLPPAFRTLTLAHTALMLKDSTQNAAWLAAFPGSKDPAILKQKEVELLLADISYARLSAPAVRERIARRLFSLRNKATTRYDFRQIATLELLLSHRFQTQGDIVAAGCLYRISALRKNFSDAYTNNMYDAYEGKFGTKWFDEENYYHAISFFDRWASPDDIDRVLALKHKRRKNSFERYLCIEPLADDGVWLELKGTLYFRRNELEAAACAFSEVPECVWQSEYEFEQHLHYDPIRYNRIFRSNSDWGPRVEPSKARYVETMLDWKEMTGRDHPRAALAWLMLGHGYFHSTYYGDSWMMFSYGQSGDERYPRSGNYNFNFYPNSERYQDVYYKCSRAVECYRKALDLARNNPQLREVAAQAAYMLHLCGQRRHETEQYASYRHDRDTPDKGYKSPWLRLFVREYSGTETFRLKDCPGFEAYL
ncbi:MAG: hypothetical protein EAZ89_20480, partial [Bacteroidetes bacterium]